MILGHESIGGVEVVEALRFADEHKVECLMVMVDVGD